MFVAAAPSARAIGRRTMPAYSFALLTGGGGGKAGTGSITQAVIPSGSLASALSTFTRMAVALDFADIALRGKICFHRPVDHRTDSRPLRLPRRD